MGLKRTRWYTEFESTGMRIPSPFGCFVFGVLAGAVYWILF